MGNMRNSNRTLTQMSEAMITVANSISEAAIEFTISSVPFVALARKSRAWITHWLASGYTVYGCDQDKTDAMWLGRSSLRYSWLRYLSLSLSLSFSSRHILSISG
jgi:hypothetical protein